MTDITDDRLDRIEECIRILIRAMQQGTNNLDARTQLTGRAFEVLCGTVEERRAAMMAAGRARREGREPSHDAAPEPISQSRFNEKMDALDAANPEPLEIFHAYQPRGDFTMPDPQNMPIERFHPMLSDPRALHDAWVKEQESHAEWVAKGCPVPILGNAAPQTDMVMVSRDDLDIVEKYVDHDLMVEKGDMRADQAFERILAITHAPREPSEKE